MVNFRKRKDKYSVGECPISTVQLNNFNADAIVKRIDYQDLIIENSVVYNSIETLRPITETTNSGLFPMQHYLPNEYNHIRYLFTDKTTDNNVPLFYKYELKFDATGFSNKNMVQIYKNNVELIPQSSYNLEFSSELLYDNYYGSYDAELDRYGANVDWGTFDFNASTHRIKLLLPITFFDKDSFYTIKYNKHYMNLDFPLHFELLELEDLYDTDTNFNITYDSDTNTELVEVDSQSVIKVNNLNKLYAIKDPYSQIKEDGLVTFTDGGDQDNASASWNLKVNTGSFVKSESKFHEETTFYNCEYSALDKYKYQAVSYLKPKERGFNVLQIEQSPIHISGYVYPDYKIDLFPNVTDANVLPVGSLGFNLDNSLLQDVTISSIDRYKGYILLNKKLDASEDLSIFAYIDFKYSLFIRNLELNPRVSDIYGISSDSTNSFSEIGIAMRKIDRNIIVSDRPEYYHPYFFDFDNPTIFYEGQVISTTEETNSISGYLNWNPYTADVNISGEFIPVAVVTLNKLSLDVLNITDARRINGGLKDEFTHTLNNNQMNSYTDIGFIDGEILPYEGLKIVHLPSHIYPNLIERWKNSNQFNSDMYTDITDYEIEQLYENAGNDEQKEYYTNLLEGRSSNGEDKIGDAFNVMRDKWAEAEASYYIDKVIKRYITAGSQYILLDENFDEIKLKLDI